ncbi:MFS transporter [Leifsonia aquatica]|uniref:MFS transporter n=1 Tax=Leifsonia aquatica TaxID=144185 RepID=UPI0028A825F5|nr:MFS transporter [Leifsonia aquatica]
MSDPVHSEAAPELRAADAIRPLAGAALPEEFVPHDEALPAPAKLRARVVFALAISQFGTAVPAVSMVLVAWPNTIGTLAPNDKAVVLSLLTGLVAVVGIIVSPIAGVLSDRCTSRLGMRRPFLIVGAVGGMAAMAVMGLASNVPMLILGAMLYAAASGIYAGGNAPLVPDQVPDRHRGRVMGLMQVMLVFAGLIASIVLPMFLGQQFLVFAIPGAAFGAAALIAVFLIQDRRLGKDQVTGQLSIIGIFAQFKVNPRSIPDYSWAWLGKAVTTMGTVLTTVYSYYYLTDHLDVSAEALPAALSLTGIVGLATAILGAVIGSWISDKFRIRKKMVLYTSLLLLVGALIAAFAPNVTVYIVALVIIGLGTGAYFPVDGAVMIDVLPGAGAESGKYMGLMTLADQVPRSLGPFLAAGILAVFSLIPGAGYPAVYIAGGVIAVIGGLLIRKVKGSV